MLSLAPAERRNSSLRALGAPSPGDRIPQFIVFGIAFVTGEARGK
jgi:hypothetical protein